MTEEVDITGLCDFLPSKRHEEWAQLILEFNQCIKAQVMTLSQRQNGCKAIMAGLLIIYYKMKVGKNDI